VKAVKFDVRIALIPVERSCNLCENSLLSCPTVWCVVFVIERTSSNRDGRVATVVDDISRFEVRALRLRWVALVFSVCWCSKDLRIISNFRHGVMIANSQEDTCLGG
jgi:hypothetical protein